MAVIPCCGKIWQLGVIFVNFCYEQLLLQNHKRIYKNQFSSRQTLSAALLVSIFLYI
jgi:hypothetical protein